MLKVWRLPCTFSNYKTSKLNPIEAFDGTPVAYFTTCDQGVDHRQSFDNDSSPDLRIIHVTEYARLRIESGCHYSHVDPTFSALATGANHFDLNVPDSSTKFSTKIELDFYYPFYLAKHLDQKHIGRFFNKTNKTAIVHLLGPEVTIFETNPQGKITPYGPHSHFTNWNFQNHCNMD
jgi:hypothetical protein